jgi:hypothetical protein
MSTTTKAKGAFLRSDPIDTGYGGLTWFDPERFDPKAKAYPSFAGPCCWKIWVRGTVTLRSWWNPGVPGHDPGTTAYSHGMQHVAVHRSTFDSFNGAASQYVGPCFSERKAKCYEKLINGPLADAWLAHNHTTNLGIDSWHQGNAIPAAVQAEVGAWQALTIAEETCALTE